MVPVLVILINLLPRLQGHKVFNAK